MAALALAAFFCLVAVGFAASTTVRAVSGRFTTTLPAGFRNDTAAASHSPLRIEAYLVGPRVDGATVNINVVTEAVSSTDVDALAQGGLEGAERTVGPLHHVSPFEDLTIDGSAARADDFLFALKGRTLHDRQVDVILAGWAYAITLTALAGGQYRTSIPALSQMLADWRWR